ncbi:MAG: NAD-binding protein [Culicoidibacterales bacterium]
MKVLIIGGGEIGMHVLQALAKTTKATVIEVDEAKCQKLLQRFPYVEVIHGSGSDIDLLEQANCEQMDVVLAVSNRDEVNLVVATVAKYDFGVAKVIARANESEHQWLFTIANGVDATIVQTDLLVQGMIQLLKETLDTLEYD